MHVLLPKLETYFLENNFTVEVFVLEEHSESFVLLFSEKVSTEKIVQDLIVPVDPIRRVTRIVVRGNFGNIPIVLYALAKPSISEPSPSLQFSNGQNNLKTDSFRNNYSKLSPFSQASAVGDDQRSSLRVVLLAPSAWLGPHYATIQASREEQLQIMSNIIPSKMGNVINFSNISPNLLFSKVSDEIKDDENSQLLLMKLEEEVNGLQTFFAAPQLLKSENNIVLYIEAMNDSCIMMYQFMEKNRSFESLPYFFEDNLGKNSDLNILLSDFVTEAMHGQVDFENEITSAMALLTMLLNSPKHVNRLMNAEFLSQFFKIGFNSSSKGLKLVNLFHECFTWLCYNKKFRNFIADSLLKETTKPELSYRLMMEKNRHNESPDLAKRVKIEHDDSDDDNDRKISKKAKKSKSNRRSRDDSESSRRKEKKKKKEKQKKSHKETDKEIEENKARARRDRSKEKKERPRSESKHSDKKKKRSEKQSIKSIAEQSESDNLINLYQRNVKALLESETRFFFNKHRLEHMILSLGQYLSQYHSTIKNIIAINLHQGSLLLHFERSYFLLKKIWKLIRGLVEAEKENMQINVKVIDKLKSSVREVLQSSSDIFDVLQKNTKQRSRMISNALATFLSDESFFELIILHLSNANFKSSDFYENTLSTSCRILLYIMNCDGGVCLILRNKPFVRDWIRFLKIEMDKSPDIIPYISENMLNSLDLYDSSVFGKHTFISPVLTMRCFSNPKEGKEARVSALAAQYLYLFENIVNAIGIMDNLYSSLLSLGNEYDIMLHLLQIAQMFENSLLSAQAISLVLKEEYFFETLMLILRVDSVELYDKVKYEVAVVCKILFKFLIKSPTEILFDKFVNLKETLKSLDKIVVAYCAIRPQHLREKSYIELDTYLTSLKTLIEPFEKLKEDYTSFVAGFQACSRYTHTNINTLLSNKQHFLNVEREFPKTDKKKYFGRLNDYLSFFKITSLKDNHILSSISYLKAINYCLNTNSSVYLHFVNSNIFDITNFIVLVSEMIVSCFVGLGGLSRQIQMTYLTHSTEILHDYVSVFNLGLKILFQKAQFKEQLEGHGKEYENVDLFLALINFIVIVKDIKPNYFYELCIKHVFELEEYYNAAFSPIKSPYKKHKYMMKFKSFCYSKEFAQPLTYMDNETKSMIIEIINTSVEMFAVWGKFPGSYDVLLTELIFLIFTKNINREVYFILLAIFINEPRKSANKEKIRKIIHTLLFEKVRTLKKSKLILIQKYGSIRADSLFDVFVTQSGHSTTVEYFIHSYLTSANKSLFFSFGFFLMTLVEWKDASFCSLISSTIVSVFNNAIDTFFDLHRQAEYDAKKRAENPERIDQEDSRNQDMTEDCIQALKILGKVLEMMNLLSLTGIFKIYLLEANIVKQLFEFLSLKSNSFVFAQYPIHRYYLFTKLEITKLLNVFMDEDVGFAYKEKDNLTEDKFFSEVIPEEQIKELIKILNRELKVLRFFEVTQDGIEEHSNENEIEQEIFKNVLEILKKLARNPVSKNICAYGNYSKIVKKFKKPLLKLKPITKLIFKYLPKRKIESPDDHTMHVEHSHIDNWLKAEHDHHNHLGESRGPRKSHSHEMDESKQTQKLTQLSARKLTNLVDTYLQCAFMLVTHSIEDCFLYTDLRLQALTQILSAKNGLDDWLEKMHSVIGLLKEFNIEQNLLYRSELCLYCLTTYKQEFEAEKQSLERHIDIPERVEIKVRIQKYNKSYFRFEPTLEELSKRRNFLVNMFQYMNSVLENKFLRNSKHKNFCKISFTRKIEYFFDIKCILIRSSRVRQPL